MPGLVSSAQQKRVRTGEAPAGPPPADLLPLGADGGNQPCLRLPALGSRPLGGLVSGLRCPAQPVPLPRPSILATMEPEGAPLPRGRWRGWRGGRLASAGWAGSDAIFHVPLGGWAAQVCPRGPPRRPLPMTSVPPQRGASPGLLGPVWGPPAQPSARKTAAMKSLRSSATRGSSWAGQDGAPISQ